MPSVIAPTINAVSFVFSSFQKIGDDEINNPPGKQ
jgi:hypothetical protein